MIKVFHIFVDVVLIGAVVAVLGYRYAMRAYEYEPTRLYVCNDMTPDSLHCMLVDSLGSHYGDAVYNLWHIRGGVSRRANGSYLVKPGETAYRLAMRLRGGLQDPVNVTVPNTRSVDKAVAAISDKLELSCGELMAAIDSVARCADIDAACRSSLFLPDTYSVYWNVSPSRLAAKMLDEYNAFWNDERLGKAHALGLSPCQVVTLASIVEEESAKRDERHVIAGLYLNRLRRGMRLQADPTVKFAVGDPSLKRILNSHLATQSPYNTYLVDGLPPGPIRIVDKATIDAVLDAPRHNYIYMCAKNDFSGYHNFASTLSQHNANAAKYHSALNRAKIK